MPKEPLYPHKPTRRLADMQPIEENIKPSIEIIHESLVNGQRRQMVNQIKEYGLYDFWADYAGYLENAETPDKGWKYFVDATVSYFRITNR